MKAFTTSLLLASICGTALAAPVAVSPGDTKVSLGDINVSTGEVNTRSVVPDTKDVVSKIVPSPEILPATAPSLPIPGAPGRRAEDVPDKLANALAALGKGTAGDSALGNGAGIAPVGPSAVDSVVPQAATNGVVPKIGSVTRDLPGLGDSGLRGTNVGNDLTKEVTGKVTDITSGVGASGLAPAAGPATGASSLGRVGLRRAAVGDGLSEEVTDKIKSLAGGAGASGFAPDVGSAAGAKGLGSTGALPKLSVPQKRLVGGLGDLDLDDIVSGLGVREDGARHLGDVDDSGVSSAVEAVGSVISDASSGVIV